MLLLQGQLGQLGLLLGQLGPLDGLDLLIQLLLLNLLPLGHGLLVDHVGGVLKVGDVLVLLGLVLDLVLLDLLLLLDFNGRLLLDELVGGGNLLGQLLLLNSGLLEEVDGGDDGGAVLDGRGGGEVGLETGVEPALLEAGLLGAGLLGAGLLETSLLGARLLEASLLEAGLRSLLLEGRVGLHLLRLAAGEGDFLMFTGLVSLLLGQVLLGLLLVELGLLGQLLLDAGQVGLCLGGFAGRRVAVVALRGAVGDGDQEGKGGGVLQHHFHGCLLVKKR